MEALTSTALIVTEVAPLADGVTGFTLAAADGSELPAWTPGAHLDLSLHDGMERQYSLCGDPADRSTWRIGVLREDAGRGGSAWLSSSVAAGAALTARGPLNLFALEPAASYVFIAGGIGITPILPMIAAAEQAGAAWELHYAGRSLQTMAFAADLTGGEAYKTGAVTLYPAADGARLDLTSLLGEVRTEALIYTCGPERLLAAVAEASAHWPLGALHLEHFQPKEPVPASENTEFEVELVNLGETIVVPSDRSILEVAEEAGAFVLSSCQEGTCGTCETVVLEGSIEHRDSVLTPQQQADDSVMMICVSRAARGCPKLVLEL